MSLNLVPFEFVDLLELVINGFSSNLRSFVICLNIFVLLSHHFNTLIAYMLIYLKVLYSSLRLYYSSLIFLFVLQNV